MGKIEIEIPDEIEFVRKKIPTKEWSFLVMRILQEKIRKVVRYNEILSNSKATEEDVEEISNEIKNNVWKHYVKQVK